MILFHRGQREKGIGWGLSAPHIINSRSPGCLSQRFRFTAETSALASWLDLPRTYNNQASPRDTAPRLTAPSPGPARVPGTMGRGGLCSAGVGPAPLAWTPAWQVLLPGLPACPSQRCGQGSCAAPPRSSLGEAGVTSEAPQTPRCLGPCKPQRDCMSAWDTPWRRGTKASNTVLGSRGAEELWGEQPVLALSPCHAAVTVKSPSRPGRVPGVRGHGGGVETAVQVLTPSRGLLGPSTS